MDTLRAMVPAWDQKNFIIFFVIPPLNWLIREYIRQRVGAADPSGLATLEFGLAFLIYVLVDAHKAVIALMVETYM